MNNFIKQNLTNTKILISGGTGFIGKSVLEYLYKNLIAPQKLTIITRNKDKFISTNPKFANLAFIDYLESDICSLAKPNETYDYVIHGAVSIIDQVPPSLLFSEIINGTKNMLDIAANVGAKSFINLSSGAVYGDISTKSAPSEDCLTRPMIENAANSYGLGKLAAEHYSYLLATDKMKVTSLRCFCFGGEYLDIRRYVLGYFINQAIQNKDILVQSGNGIYRSYLATDDLAMIILYTMIKANDRLSSYEVYNVGSDRAINIPELANIVKDTLNSKSKISCPNLNDSKISYYIPNVFKIRQTGLLLNSDLGDIISNTAKYCANILATNPLN